MSNYVTITDALKALFVQYQDGSLSSGLLTAVNTIKVGQYVTNAGSDKAAVFVHLVRVAEIATMAGNQTRKVRPVFLISGACAADTQEQAHDDAVNLLSNIENILAQNSRGSYWSGGGFGMTGMGSDDSPEQYGEIAIDSTVQITIAHFKLLWSCECMVAVDPLTEA